MPYLTHIDVTAACISELSGSVIPSSVARICFLVFFEIHTVLYSRLSLPPHPEGKKADEDILEYDIIMLVRASVGF